MTRLVRATHLWPLVLLAGTTITVIGLYTVNVPTTFTGIALVIISLGLETVATDDDYDPRTTWAAAYIVVAMLTVAACAVWLLVWWVA